MRIVALSISSHEKTQLNEVCCFLILYEGCVFPEYLEITTAVSVPHGVNKTSPYTSI